MPFSITSKDFKILIKKYLKIIVSIIYLFLSFIFDFSFRIFNPKRKFSRLLILYYHSIPDRNIENFIWQLETLNRLGNIVPLVFQKNLTNSLRYFSITFDDGLESVSQNAIPQLKTRNIPFSIFFPTAYIGKEPGWLIEGEPIDRSERLMSEDLIQLLDKNLTTIGSHSVSHLNFLKLSKEEKYFELSESKKYLQKISNSEVKIFSFPYGAYDRDSIKIAQEIGYKYIFTSEPRFEYLHNKSFVKGRVPIEPSDTKIVFIIKILGGYNWVTFYSIYKGKIKYILKLFKLK